METLYAIGMMVGLMKPYPAPLHVATPVAQIERGVSDAPSTEGGKSAPRKKTEWRLDY